MAKKCPNCESENILEKKSGVWKCKDCNTTFGDITDVEETRKNIKDAIAEIVSE